jgi:hypothetical protein
VALVAVTAALCVTLPAGGAHAATPTKNTLYTDASVDADQPGSIKIKVGGSTDKIAKLTLTVTCSDGSKEKVVRKNIGLLSGGYFETFVGPGQSIAGAFVSKKKVSGKFRVAICSGAFVGEFDAKK